MSDIKLRTLIEQAMGRIENLSGDKVNFAFKELFEYAERPDYLTEIFGEHFDPKGKYFVLRLDAGEDFTQLEANRKTINDHAKNIERINPEQSKDLKERYPLL